MSPVCSQPSLSVSAVASGVAPVALHDRLAAHQDLAVAGDPHLDPGIGGPTLCSLTRRGVLTLTTGEHSVWP